MATEVRMPQLGLTMEWGTVEKWLKSEGDAVKKGEVILEIKTDKLTNELESEVDGVILKILAKEGEDIPVKGLLCIIGNVGEKIDESSISESIKMEKPVEKVEESKGLKNEFNIKAEKSKNNGRIKISPLAKKTAEKMSIDYTNITGTGPGGRIIQNDILNAKSYSNKNNINQATLKSNIALMEGDIVEELSAMRKAISSNMIKSHNEIPCVTQTMKINVSKLLKFRKELNENRDLKFSVNDFLLKATGKALKINRALLVSIDGDKVIKRARINIGMAVALDDGLIVPVIKDVDKISLEELSNQTKELAIKARENRLNIDEYSGSTFTVSNMGMYQIESFTPIINMPNAAILGVCGINEELYINDKGDIYKNDIMRISLTYDHRLIDGSVAAEFQFTLKNILEEPMSTLI